MSKVEDIERAVEQPAPKELAGLAAWMDRRRERFGLGEGEPWPSSGVSTGEGAVVRDHSAFLSSYAPQDEGLYDDALTR
jgi:hypothetical protein